MEHHRLEVRPKCPIIIHIVVVLLHMMKITITDYYSTNTNATLKYPLQTNDNNRTMTNSNSDIISVMQVSTIRHPQQQPKVINVKQLNEDELIQLKKQDPFLYYSIPTVKKAKLTNSCKPIDHTEVLKEAARLSGSGMVSRRTRVSTECAPSMLLDDFLMLLIDEESHAHSQ